MKNLLEFIDDYFIPIIMLMLLIALIPLVIIFEVKIAHSDLYDLEEKCYTFYRDNNYILEECSDYENKLKGLKD